MAELIKAVCKNGFNKMKKIIFLIIIIFHFKIYCNEKFFIPDLSHKSKNRFNSKTEQEEQVKDVFKGIFELHYETWKEEFIRDLNFKAQITDLEEEKLLQDSKKIQEEKIKISIENLKKIYNKKEKNNAFFEAAYKLSLYSFMTKILDANESRSILDDCIENFKVNDENKKLFIRIHLLAGYLAFHSEKYVLSSSYYKDIINLKLNLKNLKEELVRAYIGLGDAEFEQYNFQNSLKFYEKGFDLVKNIAEKDQYKYLNFVGNINIRLLWASYRNANYQIAVNYAYNLSREHLKYKKIISEKVFEDIIRIGGIALFETRDINKFDLIASDKASGEIGKKMIVKAFYQLTSSGHANEVENIAKIIEDKFKFSKSHLDFIDARIEALKYIQNFDKLNELAYYATAYISMESVWKTRLSLSENEEDKRRNLIFEYSLPSAQYFYKLGQTTKSLSMYLKSAEIYNSRLQEHFDGDKREELLQLYADALMKGEDYENALKVVEESFKYTLNIDSLKIAWYQFVYISRKISEDEFNSQSEKYKKYENAVDGFIANFPDNPQARLALFESAKRAEVLKDYKNSRNRYEKILSLKPLDLAMFNLEEKSKTCFALANLYIKMNTGSDEIPIAAGALEKFVNMSVVNNEVKEFVLNSNYKIALLFSSNLKIKGELLNSVNFLESWVINFINNPNSGNIAVLALEDFSSMQNWEKVSSLSNYFINNNSKNNRINEVMYWKARAYDMQLQFLNAASLYDKSSFNNTNFISVDKRLYALKRALEIYSIFNKESDAARLLERIGKISLMQEKIDNTEFLNYLINSADKYYNLKNYSKSNLIYKDVLKIKNIDKYSYNRALFGVSLSNLHLVNKYNYSVIDKNINKIYIENNIKKDNLMDKIIFDVIEKLNNFEDYVFNKNYISFNKKMNNKDIDFMLNSINRLKNRLKLFKNKANFIEVINKSNILLGKMSSMLSDSYSKYYQFLKNDKFLITANILNTDAKKYFYDALTNISNDIDNQILISSYLSKYENREFKVIPQPLVQTSQNSEFIYDYLFNTFFNNNTNYKKGVDE
ncbi:MAG: hypothetical protein DCC88_01510 [Spirobacillus cienkowskii]|uniref:Tetratricopeptide repeat protein n=1 Tax=Spirobacillus cienkowskii TaxID=495820 RepID=A0A369KZH7_9BACT|nr:MAG: hypothetical protein DCC88_01510 [Spirobacillus cienkowskii]